MKSMKLFIGVGLLMALILTPGPLLRAQQSAAVLLAGYKQVPPVPSAGTGRLTVTLQGDTLTVEGNFSGLTGPFAGAFIHYGEPGRRGNQLFKLQARLHENKTGGTFGAENNRWVLSEGQLQALAEGNLYISIYSVEHRTGEIRGQIPALS